MWINSRSTLPNSTTGCANLRKNARHGPLPPHCPEVRAIHKIRASPHSRKTLEFKTKSNPTNPITGQGAHDCRTSSHRSSRLWVRVGHLRRVLDPSRNAQGRDPGEKPRPTPPRGLWPRCLFRVSRLFARYSDRGSRELTHRLLLFLEHR